MSGHNFPLFSPANIYVTKTNAREGESLRIKCNIDDYSSVTYMHTDANMYLCKDGKGIRIAPLTGSAEVTFILDNVTHEDSGNYSCVYLDRKVHLREVNATDSSTTFIQVHSPGMCIIYCINLS